MLALINDNFFLAPLALLLICTVVGLLAPPLHYRIPFHLLFAMLAVALCFGALAIVCWAAGMLDWTALAGTMAMSIFMICVWLAQADLPAGGDDGGGPPDNDPLSPPPPDWDEFDRLRARWDAEHRWHHPLSSC